MQTLYCLKLLYGKNYSSLVKIFVLELFKWAANQSVPDLNRGLSFNFWQLRSTNHEKFTECELYTEKQVLVKKMFSRGLNIDLPLQAWVYKIVHGIEMHKHSD